MLLLLFYSLIGGLFSLIGGLLLAWRVNLVERFALPLLAFSAGAFLGASFLDILPEALAQGKEPALVLLATLIGFVSFFALERLLARYLPHYHEHTHDHAEHTESLPVLLIVGDSLHNFLDGVVIALAYLANPAVGLVTTLAVAAHEIPQEIGDFSILLNQGWAKTKVILFNIVSSLFTVVGALLGYYLGKLVEPSLAYFLGATGGIFIYLAASDLIPEIHHRSSHHTAVRILGYLILGIALVGILTYWAEH